MYTTQKNLQDYSYKNITDLDQKNVVLRTCLNISVDGRGDMIDPTRILDSMPVIQDLATKAKNLIVIGHLGRPKGRNSSMSFQNNILNHLNMEFDNKVIFLEYLDEETVTQTHAKLSQEKGNIFLIENIRFFKKEDSKDPIERMEFAKLLSSMGDIFVNDAFADYRESASTYDIAKFLPSYLGDLFLKETWMLSKFNSPERPYVAVLGGSKLSEKLDVMNSLLQSADKVLVGGAMAYTLLKAKGVEIGNSLFEADKVELAKEILYKYAEKLILPVDHLVAADFTEEAVVSSMTTQGESIQEGMIAVDLGPKTIDLYKDIISDSVSILWNGPMGVYEWEKSAVGTKEIGLAINNNQKAFKLAGGGDSIAAINKFGIKNIDHICTGGGAMLTFLANERFPILDVILEKQ